MSPLIPLARGARTVVEVCVAVRPGEQVLLVTDHGRLPLVAEALGFAVELAGGQATTVVMRPLVTAQEPPPAVAAAMRAADVVLCATSGSLYHTAAAREACAAGARLLSLTEIDEAMLSGGGILADFQALAPRAVALAERLTAATTAELRAPGGTDLRFGLAGRAGHPITALAREPGQRSACPDVEAFIAPVEEEVEGVLVADASASRLGLLRDPLRLRIERGRVVAIEGARAGELEAILVAADHPGARQVAELGIGLNPAARVGGRIAEDEGAAGTAHVAIGNNVHFGGRNAAPIHLDFVLWGPTLRLDGDVVDLER